MNTIETLDTTPFKRLIMTIGELPSSYVDSMTYYEMLAWLCDYLNNQVVPAVNNNAEALIQLKEYVDHYFDSQDFQQMVNDKLDEMAEDGTLGELIGQYIDDTYVKKTDYATDEDAGVVKIGDTLDIDADGVLNQKEFDNFLPVDSLTYNYVDVDNDINTKINYALIPADYLPQLVMADPDDPDVAKVAGDVDYKYKSTFTINAGPMNTADDYTYGPIIIDHEIKVQNNLGGGDMDTRPIVTINDAGLIEVVDGQTQASEINAKYAFRAWLTLYRNGTPYYGTAAPANEPRTFLAQDTNNQYLIGVCGGRCANDTGMTYEAVVDFILNTLNFNARVIFALDGGGSSVYQYKCIRQNALVQNENRPVPNFLIWASRSAKKNGVFEAQAVNNAKMIEDSMLKTHSLGKTYYDNHKNANVTLGDQTITRITGNGVCNMTCDFTVSADGVAAYGAIITDMPTQAISAMYFNGITVGNSQVNSTPVLLYLAKDNTTQKTKLISRFALAAGHYTAHISYPCTAQD